MNNGKLNTRAGAGIFVRENDIRNCSLQVPDELGPSNQVGERLLAVKAAVGTFPLNIPLKIISDSKYTIEGLTKNLQKWEDQDFRTIENGILMKVTASRLRQHKARTTFQWVKGHSRDVGNDGANAMAAEGCMKEKHDLVDMCQIEQDDTVIGIQNNKTN
ncbi:ribonuclease H-like domain-containing protein [Mycena floridula]|nr:ribonuclease H-like domain-containing protein [Mycena floridula]